MRQTLNRTVHPIACNCRRCTPVKLARRGVRVTAKLTTRTLMLVGIILATIFIFARALASAFSDLK